MSCRSYALHETSFTKYIWQSLSTRTTHLLDNLCLGYAYERLNSTVQLVALCLLVTGCDLSFGRDLLLQLFSFLLRDTGRDSLPEGRMDEPREQVLIPV